MADVTLTLPEETATRLRARAEAAGQTLEAYLAALAGEPTPPPAKPPSANGTKGESVAQKHLRYLRERTPEQVEADRSAVLATARPARPLPPGKTLADMVVGKWPGDETDEEIRAMLEELS